MTQRVQRRPRAREPWRAGAWLLVAVLGATSARPAAAADVDPACTGAADEVRLQLRVQGLRSSKGNITVTVYPDDADRFLAKGGKLLRVRLPAAAPVTRGCVRVPAAGHYEISVYHDENDDRHFGRSLLGLPAEGYGFSNNPKSLIGLPSFEAVRFPAAAGDNPLAIDLVY